MAGEPGATVSACIESECVQGELDDTGRVTATVSSNALAVLFGRTLDLRYVSGDDTGPVTSISLRSLFD